MSAPSHPTSSIESTTEIPADLPQRIPVVEFASHQDVSVDVAPEPIEPLPDPTQLVDREFPIDLPTALRLAGANNLQIAIASERVEEAYAGINAADASWVPSLNLGVVYNNHSGQLQATEGDVTQVSRSSLFVGGGVGLGGAPLPGGSSGPARLFVDLSLTDVMFNPLAARQIADAAEADEVAVFNNTLLEVSISYLQLLRAKSRTSILRLAVQHSERLAKITSDFSLAGEGYEADAQRAGAALASQRRELLRSIEDEQVASASLAQHLWLDPTIILSPIDQQVIPIEMVNAADSLDDLIAQAIAARPEVSRHESIVAESITRIDQEHWRPLLPNVYAGINGGGFGGSRSSDISDFGDKTDFDISAVWQLENFGFGNAARRRQQDSLHRLAYLASEQVRNTVAAQVAEAYSRVHSRKLQIAAVATEVEAAERALALNFEGIRGSVLRPIEAQQAISAFVDARLQQLDTVVTYNAAQLELLRAIGLPPHAATDT
ncbi:MAG: TolC family protein [Planctomycetes bacterium]|nr:TolC family protein [Planctomycetota bacterium]